jgi:Na+/proline symporter
MFFAIAVLIPLSLIKAGGFMPIIDQAPPGYFNLTNETINVPYLLAWAAILFLNYSSAWSLVQRFYSVGSAREARKVAYGVGGLLLITPFLIMIPAFAARVILPDLEGAEIRQVYALVCRDLLPVGMVGLMIAAMFAATMSMLAGDYNAVAGVVTNDVYRGCLRKRATPAELLWVGRFATLAIGILALGIAMMLLRRPEDEALFHIMIKAFAFLLPPLAIPILAGLVSRQISNLGAIVGLIAGALTALGIFIATQVDEQYAILATNDLLVPSTAGATIAGLIIGTLISPATGEARARIDAFFNSFHQKHLEDAHLPPSARMTPLQVSGVCVIFLGIIMLLAVLPSIFESGTWISVLVALAMVALGCAFFYSGPVRQGVPVPEVPPHE